MASARPAQHSRHDRRVLRIGLILGSKIVEEKLMRERKDVTVGQSARNTFAVPVDGLPRSWPLFTVQNDRYYLSFTDAMDGRLSDGGDVKPLAAFKSREAQRRGDGWLLPLADTARGKIVLGEMTLLFQFVTEPPLQPRPHLPASVRGTFADRIDPTLSIILAVSLLIHFSVGIYAYQRDRVVHTRTTRIFNETFQRPTVVADIEIAPPRVEDDKATEAPKTGDEDKKPAAKPSDSQARRPSGDSSDKPAKPGRSAEESLRLQEEARELALNLMTGGFSSTALDRGGGDRDPKNDLNEVIENIRRTGTSVSEVGGGSGRGTRGDGDDRIGTSKGPAVTGPGETTTRTDTKVAEKVPRGRVNVGTSSSDDDTTLNPNDVMKKINSTYMRGLQQCHQAKLKLDPTAGGTVSLRFMVGPSGRVTKAKAEGFDASVDRCIEEQAKRWSFGAPKDKDGDATDATFRIALVLRPD